MGSSVLMPFFFFSRLNTERLCMPWLDSAGEAEGATEMNGCLEGACAFAEEETALWKPLVLLIPLRLGLSDINEAYIETLKVRCSSDVIHGEGYPCSSVKNNLIHTPVRTTHLCMASYRHVLYIGLILKIQYAGFHYKQ